MEGITCLRSTVQSEDGGCLGGTYLLYAASTLIEHGLDTSVGGTCQHDVSYAQRTIADDDGGHIAPSLVERRLDDGT